MSKSKDKLKDKSKDKLKDKSKDKLKDKSKDKLKDNSKEFKTKIDSFYYNVLHEFAHQLLQAPCKDDLFDDNPLKKHFKKIPKNIYKLIKSQVLNEEYESVITTLNYAIKLRDTINNKN